MLEIDPQTRETLWEFPREAQERIYSQQAGSCQRLINGNTLVTESENGRALEVSPEGQVVWEFVSPHRAGERLELVATLFEVVRLSSEEIPFAAQLVD